MQKIKITQGFAVCIGYTCFYDFTTKDNFHILFIINLN